MDAAQDHERVPAHETQPRSAELLRSGDVTAIAHFYRGEMNRLTAWRSRMDFTTNWAVIAAAGLLSFSFRNPNADAIFIVTIATLWFLLTVESRRYRFYDVWRWRVRILESDWNVTRDSSRDHEITWSTSDPTVGVSPAGE